MSNINHEDLESLIDDTADLFDTEGGISDDLLSMLDDGALGLDNTHSSSASTTSTQAPMTTSPLFNLKLENPNIRTAIKTQPTHVPQSNIIKIQPPPLPAPQAFFSPFQSQQQQQPGTPTSSGQQFIINNGTTTARFNQGPSTLRQLVPGVGFVPVPGAQVKNVPPSPTVPMTRPMGFAQQSPFANMGTMGGMPIRKPSVYVPSSKNQLDVTVKIGKQWPKYLATIRNEIHLVNPQLWFMHFQQKMQQQQQGSDQQEELKAYISTDQFNPITVHAAKKDHIGTLATTEATSALVPLLQEKLVSISVEVENPNNSSVNIRIFLNKKAFTADPTLQDNSQADIDVDVNAVNTIASPMNPEQRLIDIKKTYFKKLFEFLDRQKPSRNGSSSNLNDTFNNYESGPSAKVRRMNGSKDVTDSRTHDDLEDLSDEDLDIDEYISLGENGEMSDEAKQMQFNLQLEQIYDSMTKTVDDDESGSEEERDSDSDFDSDSDDYYGTSNKKRKKKKNKKNREKEISTPEILNVSLRNYQKTALRWMLDREKQGKNADKNEKNKLHPLYQERQFPDSTKFYFNTLNGILTLKFIPAPPDPRGGILADEMGLGKTVEIIALIASNRLGSTPSTQPGRDKKFNSKATLIVTPLTIVDQWKAEIERYTKPPLKVYIYQGSRRIKDIPTLLQFDVIITTYNTLSFEYSQTFIKTTNKRKKKETKKEEGPPQPSPIYMMSFYRVVLDEAHNIKNRKSLQSRATSAVEANRRWAVTGTPIQNHIDDLFSLFHFLRVNPHGDWRWWSKYIGKPFEKKDKKAAEALQLVISELLIRRTKNKRVNGERLVLLPPKKITLMELTFSDAEALFYKSLYEYSKGRFEEFVQSGTVLKNYANILEMLLHLRQVCDHPALIITSFQKKSEKSTMKGFLESFVKSANFQVYDSILPMLPEVLKINARNDALANQALKQYNQQVINMSTSTQFEDDDDDFEDEEYDYVEDESGATVPVIREKVKKEIVVQPEQKKRGRGKKNIDGPNTAPTGLIDVGEYMAKNWRPSTKITALVDYVNRIKHSEKSVVFSQWTSMLNLVEIGLKLAKIKYVRLDGAMQRNARENAVQNFKNDPNLSVCLISLKVGGVGLNLVWATHVFLLDPWWNPAIEEQAIDRVHRIGQDKPVSVIRFVIKNSVEERIMSLQKSKSAVAKGALDGSTYDENEDEDDFVTEEKDEFAAEDEDEDDYTAVNIDGDDEEGGASALDGFGMTKRDAQAVRLKDLEKLFY